MPKTLALYNNKGGVSKTTTTFNLAAYLAQHENKHVLIIDADSQANITELFLSSDTKFLNSVSDDLPGDSIYDALKPRLEGDAARVDVKKIRLISNRRYSNLQLLRGDINFSALAEGYFSSSIEQAITSNINQKHTYLALRRLVRDLINHHNFDYVLFDLGPSTGAISRLALLSCDAYFVPFAPDRFSALAVRSLPRVLAEWFRHDKLVLSTFKPYGLEIDYEIPKFFGGISQQFQVHRGRIKKSYERWNERIREEISSSFVNNQDIPCKAGLAQNPIVAEIENLGPLAPVAQIVGKAIFDITQSDTRQASSTGQMFYGAVFQPLAEKIASYRSQMDKLAKALS